MDKQADNYMKWVKFWLKANVIIAKEAHKQNLKSIERHNFFVHNQSIAAKIYRRGGKLADLRQSLEQNTS